jgi:hypothetical protein
MNIFSIARILTFVMAIVQAIVFCALTHISVFDWRFWACQIPVYLWVGSMGLAQSGKQPITVNFQPIKTVQEIDIIKG